MNDLELLKFVEAQSYYSLQRIVIFASNKELTLRLIHLQNMFPESFPKEPDDYELIEKDVKGFVNNEN